MRTYKIVRVCSSVDVDWEFHPFLYKYHIHIANGELSFVLIFNMFFVPIIRAFEFSGRLKVLVTISQRKKDITNKFYEICNFGQSAYANG